MSNVSNGSKELHYNTTHTDHMFQNNVINNRITVIIQQYFFTYQRKCNQELQVQLLNMIVADLQNQLSNITANNHPPDNDENPEIGTM